MTMLSQSRGGMPAPPARVIDARSPLSGCHVLVLDDEPLIAMDVACMLEDAGASVTEAGNARSAMAVADRSKRGERLACAVLDVNLGNHTCRDVAERLRTLGVPFVLHTGNLRGPTGLADRIGAPVVSKPATREALIDALRGAMDGRARH